MQQHNMLPGSTTQSHIQSFFVAVSRDEHIDLQDKLMERDVCDLRDIHSRSIIEGFVVEDEDLEEIEEDDGEKPHAAEQEYEEDQDEDEEDDEVDEQAVISEEEDDDEQVSEADEQEVISEEEDFDEQVSDAEPLYKSLFYSKCEHSKLSNISSGSSDGSDSAGSLEDFVVNSKSSMNKRERKYVAKFMKKVTGHKRKYL
jgi:hypothetical protein